MKWLKQDMIQYPVPHWTPEEDKSQMKTHTHTNTPPHRRAVPSCIKNEPSRVHIKFGVHMLELKTAGS